MRQSLNRQHRRLHCVELTVLSNIKLLVHREDDRINLSCIIIITLIACGPVARSP